MNTHVDLTFCCSENDALATTAIEHLNTSGYKTAIVKSGEYAPIGSIAFYTGHNTQWGSRWLRIAAHRLYEGRPDWAKTTPFLVSIKPIPGGNIRHIDNFLCSVRELVNVYVKWYLGEAGVDLPWETKNGSPTSYKDLMESWFDMVEEAIGKAELLKILESQKKTDKTQGFGGDIVYRHLLSTGHVVVSLDDLKSDFSCNTAYKHLCGVDLPVVSYGTSDLANVFEYLQALKLGYVLGLPVAFETYPGAHNWSWWLTNFLNPSLHILGSKLWMGDGGLSSSDKFTTKVTGNDLAQLLEKAQLKSLLTMVEQWGGLPLWQIYQQAMKMVAKIVLANMHISVPSYFTTTEKMCQEMGLWEIQLSELAKIIETSSGHVVNLYNKSDGVQVDTNSHFDNMTVKRLHQQGGWLGGACIYHLVFSMSKHGGVVVMVKDSTAGRVNLMAKEFFKDGYQLRVSPVGLFRLSAEIQNEDWSIDPLVMLELFNRWGPDMTAINVAKIWNAMEVPLERRHIGRKTVAKVTLSGVSIGVSDK